MNGQTKINGRGKANKEAFMSRRVIMIAFSLVLALASSAVGVEPRKVTLGILTSGSQDLIHNVMEQQKLLQKYNIPYERIKVLNPAPLHLFLAEKKVDIGYGGVTAVARARAEGKDLIIVHGVFAPVNVVIVKKDSPIQSFAALKGKRIGNFGGLGSATTGMLMAIARKWYGMDLRKDSELITAPGPALAGLLDKDQLAGALMGNQESVTLPLSGKYRVVLNLSEEWERRAGRAPATVTITTNEEFARNNSDLVRRYLAAYEEAVRYIRTHREVWERYAATIGLTAKEGAELQKSWGPRILEKWDRQQMEVEADFLELSKQILGPKVLKTVPEGLMTDAYNP
jgi:NitT/TauT family transport system substrate-binding protein